MTIYTLPTSTEPNQYFTTALDGIVWSITLETRNKKLYASLANSRDGAVLSNRVCLDRTYIGYGFFFYDMDGTNDPTYNLLGVRYFMVWDSDGY